jgi:hypothetical protein
MDDNSRRRSGAQQATAQGALWRRVSRVKAWSFTQFVGHLVASLQRGYGGYGYRG